MDRLQHGPTPKLAAGVTRAAASIALTAALLFTSLPVRADIDEAAAGRIALAHMPGQIEGIQRSYGMFRVGVRAKNGLRYELRIDIARGAVLRVRPTR